VPPLTPEGRDTASQAARQALAPKQTDESHLIIRQFGQTAVFYSAVRN